MLLQIISSLSILKGNSSCHFEKLLVETLREKWFFFFFFQQSCKEEFAFWMTLIHTDIFSIASPLGWYNSPGLKLLGIGYSV